MRKILLSISSLLIAGAAFNQVNFGFDTWSGGAPTGWITSETYDPSSNTVEQITGNMGSGSAIKLTTNPVQLQSGTSSFAFAGQIVPSAVQVTDIEFDFQTSNTAGDTLGAVIGFWDNSTIGYGLTLTLPDAASWSGINAYPLADLYDSAVANNVDTDSIYIEFNSNLGSAGTNGTELWIDNVNLGGSAGVYELFSNVSVNAYPNPTSDIVTFEIEGTETATIELYNAAGAVVKNVNTTSTLTNISLGNVKAGNYFYTVKNTEGKIVRSGQVIKN